MRKQEWGAHEHIGSCFACAEEHYSASYSGVSGGRALPHTAEYTEEFCEALHTAWWRAFVFRPKL
eukprot:15430118-Alexandrium_andersonii.AAC.1